MVLEFDITYSLTKALVSGLLQTIPVTYPLLQVHLQSIARCAVQKYTMPVLQYIFSM